jgi:hypothetical protein
MKKVFNNSAKVLSYNELANQNSKTITSVNNKSEEHWKLKHKFD